MGGVCGSSTSAAAKQIQEALSQQQQKGRNEIKILLLGTGESGKSTIFKQMHLLYGTDANGTKVTHRILTDSVSPCFINIIEGAKAMVYAPEADPSLPSIITAASSPRIAAAIQTVKDSSDTPTKLSPELAKAITLLWNDPNFQALWEERSKIQVLDCWGYWASKLKDYPAWGGDGWTPTEQEYLFIRTRTTGKATAFFTIEKRTFEMIDVGGQRSERRKWSAIFRGVSSVLFVAAASEYDQKLFEDTKVNRLTESLGEFKSQVNSADFRTSTFILFLNKSDLFKEKLCDRRIPLNVSGLFDDAPTGFIYQDGLNWMVEKFKQQVDTTSEGHPEVLIHVTTATDTKKAEVVLEATRRQIVKTVLDNLGLPVVDL